MNGPRDFSGSLLRAAAHALSHAALDEEDALEEATGLSADALPRLRAALTLAGKRLDRVILVHLNGPGEITGEGEIHDGIEYVFDLDVARRKKPLPELMRVVKKAEKPPVAPPVPVEAKAALPSSPPKHDIPIGRGIFSSSGKRESARPGTAPLPIGPKPTSSAAATGNRAIVRPPARAKPGMPPGKPHARPIGKPAGKPFGKPSGKPFGKPSRPSSGKPFGKPSGKPFGKPARPPSSGKRFDGPKRAFKPGPKRGP